MILENCRAKDVQQTCAECLGVPPQRKVQDIVGKINRRLTRYFGVDFLRYARRLLAQLFASPVALGDRAVRESSRSVVRIDVAIPALQVKGQWSMTERGLDRACHSSDEICGILEVVGPQYHRMARIIDKHSQRFTLTVVDTQNQNRWIKRKGRLLPRIHPQHADRTIRVNLAPVVPDVNLATPSPDSRIHQTSRSFTNRFGDFP